MKVKIISVGLYSEFKDAKGQVVEAEKAEGNLQSLYKISGAELNRVCGGRVADPDFKYSFVNTWLETPEQDLKTMEMSEMTDTVKLQDKGRMVVRVAEEDQDMVFVVDFDADFGFDQDKGFLSGWDTELLEREFDGDLDETAQYILQASVPSLVIAGAKICNIDVTISLFKGDPTIFELWVLGAVQLLATTEEVNENE